MAFPSTLPFHRVAATGAVQSAIASGGALSALVPLIGGGLLIVYSMW
jgi:hypothetical protein